MFLRTYLKEFSLLLPVLQLCNADTTLWQCAPASFDLNAIYPDLVRTQGHNSSIGEGTDGQIYISSSSPSIATKRFFSGTSSEEIHHEYWIGHSLSHPNIVKTLSLHYHTDEGNSPGHWVMPMKYLPFPLLDLLDYDVWAKRQWSVSPISCLFYQIVEAVAYSHSQGIAHRDLKVENIVVARDGTVKLIDFGSAAPSRNLLTGKKLKSVANWIGTPITMAPEVYGENFFDMEKADVWSLAVVFVRLWLGVYPWEPEGVLGGLAEDEAFQTFMLEIDDKRPCGADEEEDRLLCHIHEEARAVVGGMLEVNAERRISSEEILKSAWMKRIRKALLDGSLLKFGATEHVE